MTHRVSTGEQALRDLTAIWLRAIVRNDAEAVARSMHQEWVLVDHGISTRVQFLYLVESGQTVLDRAHRAGVSVSQPGAWFQEGDSRR